MRRAAKDALVRFETWQRQTRRPANHLHLPESKRIVFLDVYDKDEADDLTPEERKEYSAIAQAIRLTFQQKS